LVLLLIAAPAGAKDDVPDAKQEVAALVRDNAALEKRVELANGNQFYLLLDPAAGTLKLMLQGAVLRDYSVQGLEVGSPRVAFRSRNLEAGWTGRIWSQGNLDPARDREREHVQIPDSTLVTADSVAPKLKMPLLPEEIYVVPHRYHVRYEGGLSLEVRPMDLDESASFWKRTRAGIAAWFHDCRAAVAKHPEDVVRVRLILAPLDAASLYRALPPDTRLFVLPRS
jgi:hypothetical protein